MTSKEIRQTFLRFFESKQHKIVSSAPLVLKNDPTLMFNNSGMVQFKDYFLGNGTPVAPRIADTQKCLRVSGKHNDLEDVGFDGTHHTLFEMLGNWSFGDYFKTEAIAWSWELLVDVYQLDPSRIYATVFGGDEKESLESDEEARDIWRKYLPDSHILDGSKKDNFWEMGAQGPCGPCSEIHYDFRPDSERAKVSGASLVNQDDPSVVEIWNNVFMQYERKADGSLVPLGAKHVDTGMGFERLCMILQGKNFTYDTDVFTPYIQQIEAQSGIKYMGSYSREAKSDVAIRVVADHIRAVALVIADGQMPAAGGAGYVIRRILRRAVRYAYSFLGIKEPFLNQLVPTLAQELGDVFPEIRAQKDFVQKVILEEEKSFLRTLESGLKRLETIEIQGTTIGGSVAFELFDTYGFPLDLTELIAKERGLDVDLVGFDTALQAQKKRSKLDAEKQVGDWITVLDDNQVQFVGYDQLKVENAQVLKYRAVKDKKGLQYQIVLNRTPFYPEGGGEIGDTGAMYFSPPQSTQKEEAQGNSEVEKILVIDTKKENDLIIHLVDTLPENIHDERVRAQVDTDKRHRIENNHTATHLLHAALRQVVGTHVAQKGSLVSQDGLRFDLSHFKKFNDAQIAEIERIVNEKIRQNIALEEARNLPIEEARKSGAMMLFGEKYGESVRMITFDAKYSRELCGGCHVKATGQIGLFKITAEAAVAAGVRRIEAVTAKDAEDFVDKELAELKAIRDIFKNPQKTAERVQNQQDTVKELQKQIEGFFAEKATALQQTLKTQFVSQDGVNVLIQKIGLTDANSVKTLVANLEKEIGNVFIVLASATADKVQVTVRISDELAKAKSLNASQMVRTLATHINGGGGGTATLANASGTNIAGLEAFLNAAKSLI